MKKITTLTLIIIVFLAAAAYPQNLLVTGKVTDSKNSPIPGASIRLIEKNTQSIADENGGFAFENLSPGTYNLIVSFIGYETKKLAFTANPGQADLNIVLIEKVDELQSVEVVGRKEQSYKNSQSFAGTRTETPLKYLPQSISYVTKEVIQDQQAFKTSDVVKNISGVNQFSYYDNDFALRGFRASNALINGLRTATNSWSQSLLPNIERIEIIKGPASALFANTDPGGTVNKVTKKPLDENRKAINFATGSFNTYRVTTDFTGPLNESRTLLYRLNAAYQNAESFRVLQGGEDMVLAPSFSFLPDDKTQVNFDLVYSNTRGKLDRGQPIFGATAGTNLSSTPISFALGKENDNIDELNLFVTTSVQRKIGNNVTLNASYMKFLYDEDLLEHRTSNRYAVNGDGTTDATLMEMQTIRRLRKTYNDNLALYVVSDFKTGPLEHKLVTGYDYITNQSPVGNSSYNASGYRNAANTGAIRTYNPANQSLYLLDNSGNPVPNVQHFDLQNPNYSISEISQYFNVSQATAPTKYYVNGIYLQDQIKWGKVRALLGLRREFYTDLLNYKQAEQQRIEQKAFIPRVGLVYSPLEQLNLYATYTEGYQPQSAGTIGAPEIFGGPFDPLISNMIEGGAKMEFFQNRLAMNVALYQIEQNNILVNAGEANNPDLLRQIGQQRSKGAELDVYGQIMPNFSLTANFAFSEALITKSATPEEIGRLMPNAPKMQGGLWAKYTFISRSLKGVGIGLGSNHVSKRTTFSTILNLPAYTIFDAAVYYSVDKFRLSANFNNLFDKTHWVGGYDFNRLYPGTPRNFLVGIGYAF